jgi:hypothetical protein
LTIILGLALVASATATSSLSSSSSSSSLLSKNTMRSLLTHARRLEQQGDEEEEAESTAEVEDLLIEYSLKLIRCEQNASIETNDNGNPQYGVVTFRLCPSNSCSHDSGEGCSSGYADFAVSLNTFVSAYMEDQQDTTDWDDAVDSFAQCAQYEGGNDDDASYYVGPSCTSDGAEIGLALFTDEYCSTASDMDFASLSQNEDASLPFSDGGLVSTSCVNCAQKVNDDDGGYELKDICPSLYEVAPYKCEEWDITHYYWDAITEIYRFGQDTTGCRPIARLEGKKEEVFTEWEGIVFVSFLVVVSVIGAVWYTMWWKESK